MNKLQRYYRALERGRVARRRAYHVNLIEDIVVNAMTDVMEKANEQQQVLMFI